MTVRSSDYRRAISSLGFIPLLVAFCGCALQSGGDTERSHRQWQQQREASLTQPNGWLALVGKHRLTDGVHSIGQAPDNDIVLPRGRPYFGEVKVDGMQVSIDAAKGALLLADDGENAQHAIELALEDDGVPATVVAIESLNLFLNEENGPVLMVMDSKSPGITGFEGLDYYAYEPNWAVSASFEVHSPPRSLDTINAEGKISRFPNPGQVRFEIQGRTHSLEVLTEPGDDVFFVIFADQTNGQSTYGAGRFLEASPARDGGVTLDFNRAYNPPCVFTPYNNCPLPPPGNRLRLGVTAGEKKYEADLSYP